MAYRKDQRETRNARNSFPISSREQAGFRSGFRTSDHLQTLSQVVEKSKEYQFNLCLGFIDNEKAFENIDHQSLLTALEKQCIDRKYIQIIKAIYKEPTARSPPGGYNN